MCQAPCKSAFYPARLLLALQRSGSLSFFKRFSFLRFFFFFFGLTILLIYLGFAESSLLCGLSLVLASGDYSLVVAHGLLLVVASLVVDHRL